MDSHTLLSDEQKDEAFLKGRLGVKLEIREIILSRFDPESTYAEHSCFFIELDTQTLGLLYVGSIRMDIANRTVLIDAAFVDASEANSLKGHLNAGWASDMSVIDVDDNEANFLLHLMPTSAERCRQWQHRSDCEYKTQGKVPLSTNPGENVLCTCGRSVLPANYFENFEGIHNIARHATRIALPVIYPSSITPELLAEPPELCTKPKDNEFTLPPLKDFRHVGRHARRIGARNDDRLQAATRDHQQRYFEEGDHKQEVKLKSPVTQAANANTQLELFADQVADEMQHLDLAVNRSSNAALELDLMLDEAVNANSELDFVLENVAETNVELEAMHETIAGPMSNSGKQSTPRKDSAMHNYIHENTNTGTAFALKDAIELVVKANAGIDGLLTQVVDTTSWLQSVNPPPAQAKPTSLARRYPNAQKQAEHVQIAMEVLAELEGLLSLGVKAPEAVAALQQKATKAAEEQGLQKSECWSCGRYGFVAACGRCGVVNYCSEECQRKDWKEGHRGVCEVEKVKE